MYPRSFLCEEAKIKQRTPLKKELCAISEEGNMGIPIHIVFCIIYNFLSCLFIK